MLASMRKGASSFLSKALMLFLVLTFGVWGIGDMLRQNSSTLATVGKAKLSIPEFQTRLRMMQRSLEGVPPEYANSDGFKQEVVQGIVQQMLLLQEAQYQGFVLDDKAIARVISRTPQFQTATGMFDGNAFQNFLRANDTNEATFIETLRRDVASTALLESLSMPKSLGFPRLAKALTEAQGQSRSADIYIVRAADASEIKVPDDKTLEAYYNEVKQQYLTPESRTIDYVVVPQDAIEKKIRENISASDIEDRYALEKPNMTTPEKRSVTQLLFSDEGKAKEAADALKAGKKPAEVASEAGIKPTVMRETGKDALPNEAAEIVFALKEGDVSAPVKTGFGWHVFVLDGITEGKAPSLEASKSRIEGLLVSERVEEELQSLSGQFEDAIAAGDSAEKAAAALKADARAGTLEGVDAQGRHANGAGLKGDPVLPTVLAKGFALDEGQSSGFEPATKAYVAVFARHVTEQAPKPLESIKADLLKRYMAEQRSLASARKAQNVATTLEGSDAADVIAKEKLERRTVNGITLSQALNATKETLGMPPLIMRSLFDTKLGEVTAPAKLENGNWVIARVTAINQSLKEPAEDTTLTEAQRSMVANAIYTDYLQHLVVKYPVEINQNLLKSDNGAQ